MGWVFLVSNQRPKNSDDNKKFSVLLEGSNDVTKAYWDASKHSFFDRPDSFIAKTYLDVQMWKNK